VRRADRLFTIVQLLRGGRHVTARTLADRLEVSERTIYRDVDELTLCGVPIEGEPGRGYRLPKSFEIPPLMFERHEIEALVVGARFVEAWCGPGLASSARSALARIRGVVPADLLAQVDDARIYALRFGRDSAADNFDVIHQAIGQQRRLMIDYAGEDGLPTLDRTVRPLGLYFWGRSREVARNVSGASRSSLSTEPPSARSQPVRPGCRSPKEHTTRPGGPAPISLIAWFAQHTGVLWDVALLCVGGVVTAVAMNWWRLRDDGASVAAWVLVANMNTLLRLDLDHLSGDDANFALREARAALKDFAASRSSRERKLLEHYNGLVGIAIAFGERVHDDHGIVDMQSVANRRIHIQNALAVGDQIEAALGGLSELARCGNLDRKERVRQNYQRRSTDHRVIEAAETA
jgi:biotin operon repressor